MGDLEKWKKVGIFILLYVLIYAPVLKIIAFISCIPLFVVCILGSLMGLDLVLVLPFITGFIVVLITPFINISATCVVYRLLDKYLTEKKNKSNE